MKKYYVLILFIIFGRMDNLIGDMPDDFPLPFPCNADWKPEEATHLHQLGIWGPVGLWEFKEETQYYFKAIGFVQEFEELARDRGFIDSNPSYFEKWISLSSKYSEHASQINRFYKTMAYFFDKIGERGDLKVLELEEGTVQDLIAKGKQEAAQDFYQNLALGLKKFHTMFEYDILGYVEDRGDSIEYLSSLLEDTKEEL